MSKIERSRVSLIKIKEPVTNQPEPAENPIVSQQGVVFDRKNAGHGEVLVARGGEISTVRPTFKKAEGSEYRITEGIND